MEHGPDIDAMAARAMDSLPAPIRTAAEEIVVQVADLPSPEMLADLEIADPLDLTGLYDGIPLTMKSAMDPPGPPDMIWLFRQPILAEWRDRGDVDLQALVTHVLVHEMAHHFGWTDDQIAAIDRWWE